MTLSELLEACDLTQLDEEDEAFQGLDEIVVEGVQSFSHKARTLSQLCFECLGAASWKMHDASQARAVICCFHALRLCHAELSGEQATGLAGSDMHSHRPA